MRGRYVAAFVIGTLDICMVVGRREGNGMVRGVPNLSEELRLLGLRKYPTSTRQKG